VLLLLPLRFIDGLEKARSLQVNPICQHLKLGISVAIDLEVHVMSFTSQQVCYKRGTVKDVYVVVASMKTKKSMPKPKGLVCYGLEDDASILVLVLELPLPRHRAILPRPVHAIQTCEHAGQPAVGVNLHLPL
jgi:hypothetical protein